MRGKGGKRRAREKRDERKGVRESEGVRVGGKVWREGGRESGEAGVGYRKGSTERASDGERNPGRESDGERESGDRWRRQKECGRERKKEKRLKTLFSQQVAHIVIFNVMCLAQQVIVNNYDLGDILSNA